MLALVSGLHSQTAQMPQPELISVSFTAYCMELPKDLFYQDKPDAEPTTLEFFSAHRSRQYNYRGTNPIVFYQEVKRLFEDPAVVPMAAAHIPPGVKKPLLIFIPVQEPGEGDPHYNITVMDDSRNGMPGGHVLIFNATGDLLKGSINHRKVDFEHGPSQPFPATQPFAFTIKKPFRNRYTSAYKNEFIVSPDERFLLLLYPPVVESSPYIQFRLLRDKIKLKDKRPFP